MKTKEIIALILFFLMPPIGILVIWFLKIWPIWVRIILTIVVILVGLFTTGLFLLIFAFRPFRIAGNGMAPTLISGEYIMTNALDQNYKRGTIVVHKNPQSPADAVVKRIVGLPGEYVQLKNQKVYINDRDIYEAYLKDQYTEPFPETENPIQVPIDSYYVLGDKREHSIDSRTFGVIKKDQIIGTFWFSYWRPESPALQSSKDNLY